MSSNTPTMAQVRRPQRAAKAARIARKALAATAASHTSDTRVAEAMRVAASRVSA